MTEQAFIQRLKNRDESAFNNLVQLYGDQLYNVIFNILLNKEDADDVIQETFVQILQSINQFQENAQLQTWMYRIAVNKAIDHLRKKKRRWHFFSNTSTHSELHQQYYDHPGIQLEQKEKANRLFEAIARLPENQRIAFTLIRIQHLKNEEVCQIMNLSSKAIESLLSRAKISLQKMLQDYYNQLK